MKSLIPGGAQKELELLPIPAAAIPWLAARLEIPGAVGLLGQVLGINHLYASLLLCVIKLLVAFLELPLGRLELGVLGELELRSHRVRVRLLLRHRFIRGVLLTVLPGPRLLRSPGA